ncbi:hypothetical protein AUK40_04160 [Candidatus Wirthbacteria bacterium CG2_30_54_11]|uniref:EamA domain-containing protein n=1 Tax=Candidatus Wirthbacteria bacterium CG2_30_54_11 TaxID=1817892 RepID=A0A1J5IXJ5_9BACT|nr:MAG: hypothetical protein AUK40_04160 [Candidatus Wirthbacteria bacterium CG2_30_54_11]
MSYLAFAWLASIVYGMYNVIGKLTSKYAIKNIWLFSFLYGLLTLLFTVPPALVNHVGIPSHWGYIIVSGVCNALYILFFVLAIQKLDVSVIGPLFNFRTAISLILSVLLLGESLSTIQLVLISIIFIAGIFVSVDERFSIRSFLQPSIFYGFCFTFFLALSINYINRGIVTEGYWETTLYSTVFSQICLCFTAPLFLRDITKVNRFQMAGVTGMALCLAIGNIFANRAFAVNVSVSSAITSLPISMFIVFALSRIRPELLEKHTLKVYVVRFAAAFVMIGAALAISL